MCDDPYFSNFTEVAAATGGDKRSFAYEKRTGDRLIRIEKEMDAIVAEATKSHSNVMKEIASAREAQSKRGGNASLLTRKWETKLERLPNTFTVAQFNALAEGLSSGPDVLRPFAVPESRKKRNNPKDYYGGFDAIEDPDIVLDFKIRRWRLIEVIVGSNAQLDYDIIAMEEVDRFYGFFAPILQTFGYTGVFTPKNDSPGSRTGWYSDGCCLFWKEDMFEMVAVDRHGYKVGTQVYMIVTLRHKSSNKLLVVAVTHLKAQASSENERIRSHQVDELLASLKDNVLLARTKYNDASPAVLITGDFNAVPQTTAGKETCISKVTNSNEKLPLASAYPLGDTGLFTTWKIRGVSEAKRAIDYIFFGGPLKCVNKVLLPVEDDIGDSRLPSIRFPSDHVHIAAQLEVVL